MNTTTWTADDVADALQQAHLTSDQWRHIITFITTHPDAVFGHRCWTRDDLPREYHLTAATTDPHAAAHNPTLTPEAQDWLLDHHPDLIDRAYREPFHTPSLRMQEEYLWTERNTVVKEAAARCQWAAANQQRLTRDRQSCVREALAGNPLVNTRTLTALLSDRAPQVRLTALTNPALPNTAQRAAAADADADQWQALAVNPRLIRPLRAQALAHPDTRVVLAYLRNPHLPAAHHLQLARHPQQPVKEALAARRDLTPAAQTILTRDTDATVRAAVAANPHASDGTHLTLAHDSADTVRASILQYSPHPAALIAALTPTAWNEDVWRLKHRSSIPPQVLHHYVAGVPDDALSVVTRHLRIDEPTARTLLARNPRLWEDVATWFPHPDTDPDPAVRLAYAAYPNTRIRERHRLTKDTDPTVRAATVANLRVWVDSDLRHLRRLAVDPDPTVRAAVAAQSTLPIDSPDLWQQLVTDRHPMVRATAVTTATDTAGLTDISTTDPDPTVRDAAANRWTDLLAQP